MKGTLMKQKTRERLLIILVIEALLPITFLLKSIIAIPFITFLLLDWDEQEYQRRFNHEQN